MLATICSECLETGLSGEGENKTGKLQGKVLRMLLRPACITRTHRTGRTTEAPHLQQQLGLNNVKSNEKNNDTSRTWMTQET